MRPRTIGRRARFRFREDSRAGAIRIPLYEGQQDRVVDRAKGVIKNVKVLGTKSINGRSYTLEAMRRAIPLYEGVMVNIDHPKPAEGPDGQRSSYDRFGRLVRVHCESDGLYADLEFLTSHAMAARVCEDAERGLGVFGLSHNAGGAGSRDRNGNLVIQEITHVRHVDLVADPATVTNLFESVQPQPRKKRQGGRSMSRSAFAKLLEGLGLKKPKKGEKLVLTDTGKVRLVEATGGPGDDARQWGAEKRPLMLDDDEEPMDSEIEEEPDVHDHATGMFGALLQQVKDGELEYDAFKSKVGKLLGFLQDDEEDDGGGDDDEEDDGGDADDEEDDEEEPKKKGYKESVDARSLKQLARHKDPAVRTLVEALDRERVGRQLLEHRQKAVELCKRAKLPKAAATPVFLESLYACKTTKAMKRLIRDRRTLVESRSPRSLGPSRGMPEIDAKTFARAVR
jgi:hypothetical protein